MSATAAQATVPDLGEAARFLRALDPDAQSWSFQTFDDNKDRVRAGKAEAAANGVRYEDPYAKTLRGSLEHRAEELEELAAQGAGVFVTINETEGLRRKASNVTRVRALFADFDKGGVAHDELTAALSKFKHEPHIIVQSSPGKWHTYWLVNGLEPTEFKARQQELIARFDSDKSVCDPSRVMRLPGFFHRKGEPHRTVLVLANPEGRLPYEAADLVMPASNVVPFNKPKPKAGKRDWQALIDNGSPEGERNGDMTALCGYFRGRGEDNETAPEGLFTWARNCTPPVSAEEVQDRWGRVLKEWEAGDAGENAAVAELNERFAFVVTGGQPRILVEQGKEMPEVWAPSAFHGLLCNRYIKHRPLSKLWMEHPARRGYERIVFRPDREVPNAYNMWRGFAVEPGEGNCELFLRHLRDNVASGDSTLSLWVFGWFAQIFQQPTKKLGTSLALRGGQGSGKTIVGKVFGHLLGAHYTMCDDPHQVVGKFSGHLANKILIHADEALFAGDPAIVGRLRSMVSSDKINIERKGIDIAEVENFSRLFISTDKDWAIPANIDDRRFAVLDMGEDRKQDRAYFAAMLKQLEEENGYAALMKRLMDFDLSRVDVGDTPKTAALMEQKARSMDPVAAFWYGRLHAGEVLEDSDEWPSAVAKSAVYEAFSREVQKTGKRALTSQMFGQQLSKLCSFRHCKVTVERWLETEEGKKKTAVNVNGYAFPELAECRRQFEERTRQTIEWNPVVSTDEDGNEVF